MVSQEELENASWRKSSQSDEANSGCVSMASLGAFRAIRDSKDPHGPALVFNATELRSFFAEIRRGGFDFPNCGTNGGAAG
ncbi:DUF397 domain-containing protein [Actinomadura alba]|uniref:DUF397 domain-containing protein n=1 Tax=Actinomadura alba TaxID=406431 RepID=A0ABR7LWY8_9ACTN|nr:DUF397 domain-containing protein [Actinomadura alba]